MNKTYEILIFSQLLAYLDDAVKQFRTLSIQFCDVRLCQTLSLFMLECSGMINVLQMNSLRVGENQEILDALRQCLTLRIEQP